jgi:hypothetical protein
MLLSECATSDVGDIVYLVCESNVQACRLKTESNVGVISFMDDLSLVLLMRTALVPPISSCHLDSTSFPSK